MNYIQTQYMTNNGKTCKVTAIYCNAPKQTNLQKITEKMDGNAFELFWTNMWGQPTGNNVNKASISEMESEDENNNATYFDAVLTFRHESNGNIPKTASCTIKNIHAVEVAGDSPSSIPVIIRQEWQRLSGYGFEGNLVYLANAVLTFHD